MSRTMAPNMGVYEDPTYGHFWKFCSVQLMGCNELQHVVSTGLAYRNTSFRSNKLAQIIAMPTPELQPCWRNFLEVLKHYCNELGFGRSGNSMGVPLSHHHWTWKSSATVPKVKKLFLEGSWFWLQIVCAKKHFDTSVRELLMQGRSGLTHC